MDNNASGRTDVDDIETFTTSSPIDTVSKDKGSETTERYGYQWLYTALIAIQMYGGNYLKYKEIFCEQHEDILAVTDEGLYVGIQIKTRELSLGFLKLNDPQVKNSVEKFVCLNRDFPDCFVGFILVSNCPFHDEDSGTSFVRLLDEAKTTSGNTTQFSHNAWEGFVKDLSRQCEVPSADVLYVLSITDYKVGPGIQDISAVIANDHLAHLSECKYYSALKVRSIVSEMKQRIAEASSRPKCPIADYDVFVKGGRNIIRFQEINAKRITKESISNIIQKGMGSYAYLKSTDKPNIKSGSNHLERMKSKMNFGGIDPLEIETCKDLVYSADLYFAKQFHMRETESQGVPEEIIHIRTLVQNEAAEARTKVRTHTRLYGSLMLSEIQKTLRNIASSEAHKVFHTPYEILKGVVGTLTGECRIYFSESPDGGF